MSHYKWTRRVRFMDVKILFSLFFFTTSLDNA